MLSSYGNQYKYPSANILNILPTFERNRHDNITLSLRYIYLLLLLLRKAPPFHVRDSSRGGSSTPFYSPGIWDARTLNRDGNPRRALDTNAVNNMLHEIYNAVAHYQQVTEAQLTQIGNNLQPSAAAAAIRDQELATTQANLNTMLTQFSAQYSALLSSFPSFTTPPSTTENTADSSETPTPFQPVLGPTLSDSNQSHQTSMNSNTNPSISPEPASAPVSESADSSAFYAAKYFFDTSHDQNEYLNAHFMYTFFDAITLELFPEETEEHQLVR